MAALGGIATMLDLDYAGIDFAIDADGNVLLFEANPTMAIYSPTATSVRLPPSRHSAHRRGDSPNVPERAARSPDVTVFHSGNAPRAMPE